RSSTEGHVQMRVLVDAAREKQHAGGVESLVRWSSCDAGADFLDCFAFDQHVRRKCFVGGNDGAVLNENSHQSHFLPVVGGFGTDAVRCSQDSAGKFRLTSSMVMQSG